MEEVIAHKYVLLNRAPTLHRLGIQAFRPILIEGNAIQVHPLVCTAFNADFDGDQMPVHIPLSEEAQAEAREIMASNKNILKPGSGEPTVVAKLLDIILGAYWMTKVVAGEKGEGKIFPDPSSAITARTYGEVSLRAKIKVLAPETPKFKAFAGTVFETTVGRLLFNDTLPVEYPYVNQEVDKKLMAKMVDGMMNQYGINEVPRILDKIKKFGFKYATLSGTTWGIDDVMVPEGKYAVIADAKKRAVEIEGQFNEGLLSEEERRRLTIEVWHGAKNDVEKLIPGSLDPMGSVSDMVKSGARGSVGNITQMVGMKGLIATSSGETIELPILSSMKED